MGDPYLWNVMALFIDGPLVLATNWVDLGSRDVFYQFDCEGDPISQFDVLSHEFGYFWALVSFQF